MKLHERLNLRPQFWDHCQKLKSLAIYNTPRTNATGYDLAWDRFHLAECRHLLSLSCYYSDEYGLVKEYAAQCIGELEEFFFGDWRNSFQTPEKRIDPGWWKRGFIWMQVFEAAVLWGSVLGNWDYLKRVGSFPEPDSCISDGYRAVDRDLYVAWGAFLRGAKTAEIEPLLDRVQAGKSRSCKLMLVLLRAGLARDTTALQNALVEWLKYYRKEEFPEEKVTKKITIEGTFFVHWAEKEGLAVVVPAEFSDHIVRVG